MIIEKTNQMNVKQIKHNMRNNVLLLAIFGMAFMASCSKDFEDIRFDPDVKIQFSEGGDSSIVDIGKGITDYTAEINVTANGAVIRLFEIYEADPRSGSRGALIEAATHVFDNPASSYSTAFSIPDLTENTCIKIVVTDTLEQVYERNLLVRITPSVHFSEASRLETADHYYGSFFATWYDGRAYMRDTEYADAIDFSVGEAVIESGESPVPALVNPAKRRDYQLLTIAGLQDAKFALTDLTPADYRAITRVDAAAINSLPDPDSDAVQLAAGNVYLFKTQNGKKGLIHTTAMSSKTATVEQPSGGWAEQTIYEISFTTKTVW